MLRQVLDTFLVGLPHLLHLSPELLLLLSNSIVGSLGSLQLLIAELFNLPYPLLLGICLIELLLVEFVHLPKLLLHVRKGSHYLADCLFGF